ncbi:MAG TPA: CHAT domain-containing protein [Pyrinomonadaceae bacterium]
MAARLVEVSDQEREALLRESSACLDPNLAHLLKDICLNGWSSDPARALAAAESLVELSKQNPDPEIAALTDWGLGLASLIRGEMEAAIESLDTSSAKFLELDLVQLSAATQVSKLIALAMLGRYEEAIECGLKARAVFIQHADSLTLGKIEHNLGNIYFRRDQYREAEEFQRLAMLHFAEAADEIQLAKIENSLALTLSQQHKTKAAEELYESALERAHNLDLKSTQAEIESSIGTLALYQGYYDRALDYLERSRRKYAELNLPHVLAMTEQEIADAYLELNLLPEAEAIYERVEKQFSTLGMNAEQARALAYHGRAEIGRHHFDQAQKLLSDAREVYIKEQNEVGAALVELTEAQLLLANADFISAQAVAHHAESVLSLAGNSRRVVFAQWLKGEAARCDDRLAEASDLLNYALAHAQTTEQPDIVARCLTSLGLVSIDQKQPNEAEKFFKSAIEVIEKLRAPLPGEEFRTAFFSGQLLPYLELAKLALNNNQLAESFGYVEKARSRSLVDELGGRLVNDETHDDFEVGLLQTIDEKRHELTYFYNQINNPTIGRNPEDVTKLQDEARARESSIAELSRQLQHSRKQKGSEYEAFDLHALQTQLSPHKALVEYVAFGDELVAYVVTDSNIEIFRELGSVEDISGEVAKFRFQIDSLRFGSAAIRRHLPVLTARVQKQLQGLYNLLIRPLIEVIQDRDLIIVPAGHLNYLPFQALHDGEHYLVEQCSISLAPSATVLWKCLTRRRRRVNSALLVGVPDERTQKIAQEIEALRKVFPHSTVLTNQDATIAALKNNVADVDVVHLACHAQFRADNPRFSSLKLADDWLSVDDAYNLNLNCSLVTLSACETGVNSVAAGEELIGLARGFLSAGTPSILLSLWTVDDEATSEFMVEFYSELKQTDSVAEALRQAQVRQLKSKPHPFFWSPFVLVGRW